MSNGWAFVDDYTPLSDWNNVIVPNQFNLDNVHWDDNGRLYAGSIAVRQLGLLDLLYASGRK